MKAFELGRNKMVLAEIREVVDPEGELSDAELVQRIETVFAVYTKNLDRARERVRRHRAKKKALQNDTEAAGTGQTDVSAEP